MRAVVKPLFIAVEGRPACDMSWCRTAGDSDGDAGQMAGDGGGGGDPTRVTAWERGLLACVRRTARRTRATRAIMTSSQSPTPASTSLSCVDGPRNLIEPVPHSSISGCTVSCSDGIDRVVDQEIQHESHTSRDSLLDAAARFVRLAATDIERPRKKDDPARRR